MKKLKLFVLTIGILLLSFSNVQAECSGVCTQYCGQGYCTDYIFHRLHVKQSGNAVQWRGNISADQVQPGDVAVFEATSTNSAGHVAIVESVNGDTITISEWNWGILSTNPIEAACGVTDKFGELHQPYRTIPKSSVARFWRPNFSDDSQPMEIVIRQVGEYGWYPPNKTCINASNWFKISNGKVIQQFGDKNKKLKNLTIQFHLLQ